MNKFQALKNLHCLVDVSKLSVEGNMDLLPVKSAHLCFSGHNIWWVKQPMLYTLGTCSWSLCFGVFSELPHVRCNTSGAALASKGG
jgi:hypothetical protein